MEQLQPEEPEEPEVGEDGLTDEERQAIGVQIYADFCNNLDTYFRGKNTSNLGDALTAFKTKKTTPHPHYPSDAFNRFKPYRHLEDQLLSTLTLTGTLREAPLFNVSVRHLTEQHYLWFIGLQDRRDLHLHRCYPSLEKLDFDIDQIDSVYARLWLQVLTYEQQLRYLKVVSIELNIWTFIMWLTMKYYRQPLLRHLHSLMLLNTCNSADLLTQSGLTGKQIELMNQALINLLVQYSPQLKHLTLNYLHPWLLHDEVKFPKLPRIKSLLVPLATGYSTTFVTESIFDKSMPTMECLSLKVFPGDIIEEMVLFELLYEVPNLKKLKVEMFYAEEVKRAVYGALGRSVDKLKAKCSEKARVWKVEVLSLETSDPEDLLALFEPFFRFSLQKLQIQVQRLLLLNLHTFTSLQRLTLDFYFTAAAIDTTTVFQRMIVYDRIRVLTVANLSPITHLLMDCFGQAFPGLTELNVGSYEEGDYVHLKDLEFSEVLARSLRKLTILRFTDDHTKGELKETIQVMFKRAEELKKPVLLRVPLGAEVMKNSRGGLPMSKYFKLF